MSDFHRPSWTGLGWCIFTHFHVEASIFEVQTYHNDQQYHHVSPPPTAVL